MANWVAGIWAALKLVNSIIDGAKALKRFIEESRKEAWFQEWSSAMVDLRAAKTPEDRKNVARKIRDALGGL